MARYKFLYCIVSTSHQISPHQTNMLPMDHATWSVTIGCIYMCNTEMRPKNKTKRCKIVKLKIKLKSENERRTENEK